MAGHLPRSPSQAAWHAVKMSPSPFAHYVAVSCTCISGIACWPQYLRGLACPMSAHVKASVQRLEATWWLS
ncbi:hypothetical protein Micbo1qcDRAFT_157207 [Microdochium bolleyi]|uniref:Uncharacterized protein n=1 Tax=Microdochium bolleyi TaxID=196109 RepID=A0A136JDW6_9PEZI|nr:hypothetical protein Micbo1qcDRAFT_157207 [Microdochium bolleyi]